MPASSMPALPPCFPTKLSANEPKSNSTTDRLSDLPDSIISHILSLLPMKEAVATSTLSKSWKHLWTSLPNLDFNYYDITRSQTKAQKNEDHEACMTFAQVVYRVLMFLDVSTSIKRFRLGSWYEGGCYCDSFDLNTWVHTAMQRNVEELELEIINRPAVELRRTVFTCGSLVVLKLGSGIVVDVPSSVYLPNLKTLEFNRVCFSNNDTFHDALQNLLTNCPVLENLCVQRDFSEYVIGGFRICSPKLKNLTLDLYHDKKEAYAIDKLEIEAPALEYLNLMDTTSSCFSVQNLSSLVVAELYLWGDLWDAENYGNGVVELLRVLYNVKFLTLRQTTMKFLRNASNFNLCTFPNLTRLELDVHYDYWPFVPNFLQMSHNLKVLVINKIGKKGGKRLAGPEKWWQLPPRVPNCLVLHLLTIDIMEIEGSEDELEFFRYFLKHAKVLKTMNIQCDIFKLEEKLRLLKIISMLPQGSKKYPSSISRKYVSQGFGKGTRYSIHYD